jgi:hypothetical protein
MTLDTGYTYMTVKPRTIDNLGIDSSIRYAKDQAQLDTKLIEESRFIPQKTEVAVVRPYIPTEFDRYITPAKLVLWASFPQPPESVFLTRAFFSYQLIPSLGSLDKEEGEIEKLEAMGDALEKEHKERNEEDEHERQVILSLLKTIVKLDRTLGLINSRRNQYQRG